MNRSFIKTDHTIIHPPLRFASIKPRPRSQADTGSQAEELNFYPDTCMMGDRASGGIGKGHVIPVQKPIWQYLEKINVLPSYLYIRKPHAELINIDYDYNTPYSSAWMESINNGCNVVSYYDETVSYIKLFSLPWYLDTNKLDRNFHNWFTLPYLFPKLQAISPDGKVIRPANALDVYSILIHYTELWIHKSLVELWPTGYNYKFRGLDVYNGNKPLMLTDYYGVRTFPTSWKISTQGVIPPKNWKQA